MMRIRGGKAGRSRGLGIASGRPAKLGALMASSPFVPARPWTARPHERLQARPGVLVIDVAVGLALVALVLTAAAVILPLWVVALAVVGLLTAVVGVAEWVLWRAGALRSRRLTPPLRRTLHRLLHPLPARQPPDGTPEPSVPGESGR
jgi:hypothetical protein